MKLMHGKLSPFVRKVMIAIHEKGLAPEVEIVPAAVGQGKINRELMQLNPTGKIPTLVTDDNEAVYDSLVIIDYLDDVKPEPRLIPADATQRRRALKLNAIGDGLLVAGVLAKGEAARPAERQWPELIEAQWAKVQACIAALDRELRAGPGPLSIGEIAAACALGWLEVRAPEEAWRDRHPGLAAWFTEFSNRPAMIASRPPAP